MVDTGTTPIDMSLMAPRPERLIQLSEEMGYSYGDCTPEQRVEVYKIAQMEQLVSAVGVLAQFAAGAR